MGAGLGHQARPPVLEWQQRRLLPGGGHHQHCGQRRGKRLALVNRQRHATLPQSWMQRENWEFETHRAELALVDGGSIRVKGLARDRGTRGNVAADARAREGTHALGRQRRRSAHPRACCPRSAGRRAAASPGLIGRTGRPLNIVTAAEARRPVARHGPSAGRRTPPCRSPRRSPRNLPLAQRQAHRPVAGHPRSCLLLRLAQERGPRPHLGRT